MSYIGRYPDVTLDSLTIGKSKPVNNIASTITGSSTTSLVNDSAIYNYINTFEITDFNAGLSDANIINCKTENLSSKPNALTKRNSNTCVLNSENFQCKYQNEIFVLNDDIDMYIPDINIEQISLIVRAVDFTKIEVSFINDLKDTIQSFNSRFIAFKNNSGTSFVGRLIYQTETTATLINIKYFNIIEKITEYSEIQIVKLYNVMFAPKEQTVKLFDGTVNRSNNTPLQSQNNDLWLNIDSQQWYYNDEGEWKSYDGFLVGQIIQDSNGILACSTSDTQHLLVNFNNSLLQHNTYNVMNYHGNSHITVDKKIVEAPLNERLTWPRYQNFDSELVYCYIDSNGTTQLDELAPIYRDNFEYLCHPIHYWRCLGYANFVNGKFTNIKTFGKSDFQTTVETVYYNNQILLEVNGNIGTNLVNKEGRFDVRQTGYYQVDLVGGGGGGTGDTYRKKVKHTWVTHSYSNNSFACQGSSGSYISITIRLERADYLTYTVGYGGRYKNTDAGDSLVNGSTSYCRIFTHNQPVYMTAPNGNTSSGSCGNHILAPQAAIPTATGLSVNNEGQIIKQVQGAQGTWVYHEDNWYINLPGNISPVNNQPYCWGAGGKSINSGNNSHIIDDGSHGVGGWLKLTYLGQTI